VPIEDRHVTTSAVGPGGLWLEELSGRLPIAGVEVAARRC